MFKCYKYNKRCVYNTLPVQGDVKWRFICKKKKKQKKTVWQKWLLIETVNMTIAYGWPYYTLWTTTVHNLYNMCLCVNIYIYIYKRDVVSYMYCAVTWPYDTKRISHDYAPPYSTLAGQYFTQVFFYCFFVAFMRDRYNNIIIRHDDDRIVSRIRFL